MPDYTLGLDIVSTIVICAYAAVVLVLAILAVAVLFKQKKILVQINNTLIRQGAIAPGYAPPAKSCAPPVPNTCPKCGAAHASGAAFCQNCGAAIQ
jgi:methionyl-tRNA synthetase